MLSGITFTGVDQKTDAGTVRHIHRRYPKTEFAVLAGNPDNGNRYPGDGAIRALVGFIGGEVPLALHLCGSRARSVFDGSWGDDLLDLCEGYGRVQVNSSNTDHSKANDFAEALGCERVILQRRGPVSVRRGELHPKIEFLFDRSGGRGAEGMCLWDDPPAGHTRSGYAGGLGAHNIERAVTFAQSVPGHIWLDMESRIRDADDWMDLEVVASVCEKVFGP